MLFPGDIHITLDENRRLKLPAVVLSSYDQCGGREVVLHYWPEGSLGILPLHVWSQLYSAKGYDQAASLMDMHKRLEMQRFLQNTKRDEISAQGRLTIPANLCACVGLVCGQEVVLTSCGQYLNAWNPQRLAEVMAHFEELDQQEREDVFAPVKHSQ
ncbi:MAG: hypothetical protein GX564_13205 [Oligosphaeraceae bacterium]|nr:hypothetical protein [Oligosphaeraceae bacterium]